MDDLIIEILRRSPEISTPKLNEYMLLRCGSGFGEVAAIVPWVCSFLALRCPSAPHSKAQGLQYGEHHHLTNSSGSIPTLGRAIIVSMIACSSKIFGATQVAKSFRLTFQSLPNGAHRRERLTFARPFSTRFGLAAASVGLPEGSLQVPVCPHRHPMQATHTLWTSFVFFSVAGGVRESDGGCNSVTHTSSPL